MMYRLTLEELCEWGDLCVKLHDDVSVIREIERFLLEHEEERCAED